VEISNPSIEYGRHNLDFGKGFYVTTLRGQAEKWALRRASMAVTRTPIISTYEFSPEGLNILSFEGYTEEWLDFVVENRQRVTKPLSHTYDAIFGNIADDDVVATVDEYMRLLLAKRVNRDVKNATIFQRTFEPPNNRYCIAIQKGIEALKFIKSYRPEE
jgi:hypothetical protein